MREIRFRELDPREAARWAAALEEPTIFAEHAFRIVPALCAIGMFGLAFITLLVGMSFAANELVQHSLLYAVAGACIGWLGFMAQRARTLDRARFPPGRYLYRWGYAEVDLEGLRFVPGALLRHEVAIGPPRISGASRIVVRLSTDDGWSTSFRLIGSELDVPYEQLASLVSLQVEVHAGYRSTAVRPVEGSAPSRRVPFAALATLAGALVAASLPVFYRAREAELAIAYLDGSAAYPRAVEIRSAYWYFPWIVSATRAAQHRYVDRARARIEHEVRAPYREALLAELSEPHPDAYTYHDCAFTRTDLEALYEYADAHADHRTVAEPPEFVAMRANAPLDYYFYDLDQDAGPNDPSLDLASDCTFTPVGISGVNPVWASFDVDVQWTLSDSGVTLTRRRARIDAQAIEAVGSCARGDREPAEGRLRAAGLLVGLTIRRDVFEPAAPAYLRSPYADGWDELLPCAEREAASITPTSETVAPR